MRHMWTSFVGLGVLLSILLPLDESWARPKRPTTYFECKCTCMWQDELGKEHFGPSGAVQFTESTSDKCLGHSCTTTTPTGTRAGTTRDCRFQEKSAITNLPLGNLHTLQPKTPTTSGGMRVPTPGMIQRRGVEGEQPAQEETQK